ncbi:cytochrome P450 [Triangularia setosa]|uniref:Cytochrome P450 n=1 Tax=Triangularia setosa TaxID=2587417 RepID=A0AAN6W4S0_9PEZI|nr:cytochrome P450 [Podospora setosa]
MYALQLLGVGAISALLMFVTRFYAARKAVWKLQSANLPMPEFKLVFGHFPALKETVKNLPKNTTLHTVMMQLSKRFPSGMFYINMWPFSGTWLVVTTPSGASQCQTLSLIKPSLLTRPLEAIGGGPSLITMNGETHKRWRSLFNPGFSPGYLVGLAPMIADEVVVFCGLLRERARTKKGEVLQLEDLTLRLTVDTIGAVALDTRLHHQIKDSQLALALQRQIEWTSFGTTFNPFKRYLTIRPLVLWYNNRIMDRLIGQEIDKRYTEHLHQQGSNQKRSKSVMSLVLAQFLEEAQVKGAPPPLTEFKKLVAPQLRGFLFAGRDTTSSTLLYCFHLLATHPEALKKLRSEHGEAFGAKLNASKAHQTIAQEPQRLNQLPYTTAVIKEVLRLFPPSASLREGRAGVDLVDDQGRRYPTEGCNVWTLTVALHHNALYWKHAESFVPERWLVGPEDPMYPVKGAWRAFEFGPRGCIGQTLALMELRVALVMTLAEFNITPAYEEWDRMHPRPGVKMVNGNRAYQAEKGGGGAHPADGFPCWVTLRGGREEWVTGDIQG